ncbi:Transposase, MuDR, plant [Plasmopara halstedii]|uniref:Transposase, MuDR, plant n=1 Tax=Plasmopara halstedii TaxID=4781 RepID=A0A0P1A5A6_PLAHL|nr:Transposase, MuDR, plant [Plasmopara halstedii]CEG35397.1 Transposase, MuDR, plant [Plasmopara halstedii]|eukprot:XP_024571766.1 Transposase, MuDR, plant [Plasmopara halstedii]
MVESSQSDADAIVLSSESECDQQASQSCGEFFHSGEHTCKDDIISAVIDYHAAIYRPFRVAKSDQRRYKAICKNEGCPFEVQFSFYSSFQSPTKFVPHECRVTECDTLSQAMNRS